MKILLKLVEWVGRLFRRRVREPDMAPPTVSTIEIEPVKFEPYRKSNFESSASSPAWPAIELGKLLTYWADSLDFYDLSAIRDKDTWKTKIGPNRSLSEIELLGYDSAPEGDEKEGIIVICSGIKNGKQNTALLLGVPILIASSEGDKDSMLFIPTAPFVPIFNARLLSPQSSDQGFEIASRSDAEKICANFSEKYPPNRVPVWADYWREIQSAFFGLLNSASEPEACEKLNELRSEGRREPSNYDLFVAVFPKPRSGSVDAVRGYYEEIRRMDLTSTSLSLLRTIAEVPNESKVVEELTAPLVDPHSAHMDELDGGKRSIFKLDRNQRLAVAASLHLEVGKLSALNGPPGSGKTAMLRSLIASTWVNAALARKPVCPIIIAVGATNQSVRNVISAFSGIPHNNDECPMARRWISCLPTFGVYAASRSLLNDAEQMAELRKFLFLEQNTASGNLFRFRNLGGPSDPLDGQSFSVMEEDFLRNAERATKREFESVLQVQEYCHRELQEARNALQNQRLARSVLTRETEELISKQSSVWTEPRKKALTELRSELSPSAELTTMEELLDLTWRPHLFHLASHYWEATFLVEQQKLLFSRSPANVEEALRRVSMLTPCIVTTFHNLPNILRLDEALLSPDAPARVLTGIADLVIFDEAGQAPPNLATPAFACGKRAAIVGDVEQLKPVPSVSDVADQFLASRAGCDFGTLLKTKRSASGSVLGSVRPLAAFHDTKIRNGISLLYHYRCVPSIIGYCNELVYGRNGRPLKPKTRDQEMPEVPHMGWVEVDSLPTRTGSSFTNEAEACEIVDWIEQQWPRWKKDNDLRRKKLNEVVAVLTPYRPQAQILKEKIKNRFSALRSREPSEWPTEDDVKRLIVGTVHALQGAECPFVCFSLVEGPEEAAGSFIDGDPALMNVAVSRAKRSFIVFGNKDRLFKENDTPTSASVHLLGQYLRRGKAPQMKRLYPDTLVIIEAAGKVRTLRELMGKPYHVMPTYGAVTFVPIGGVSVHTGFIPQYLMRRKGEQAVAKIAAESRRGYGKLIIATDDDQMGELIGWQIHRLLKLRNPDLPKVQRLRLGALTQGEIAKALANLNSSENSDQSPFNDSVVCAAAAREIMDAVFTQRISKLLKDADPSAPPLGRVQSATIRLIDELTSEHEVEATHLVIENVGSGIGFNVEGSLKTNRPLDGDTFTLKNIAIDRDLTFSVSPARASTIEILARASHLHEPWIVAGALQSLYDGSWAENTTDLIRNLKPAHEEEFEGRGHPPVHPIFADFPPNVARKHLSSVQGDVYEIVWNLSSHKGIEPIARTIVVSADVHDATGTNIGRATFEVTSRTGHTPLPEGYPWPANIDYSERATVFEMAIRNAISEGRPLICRHAQKKGPRRLAPGELLRALGNARIGRPSTVPGVIKKLAVTLIDWKPDHVTLTKRGKDIALLLRRVAPQFSDPHFSTSLAEHLQEVEEEKITVGDLFLAYSKELEWGGSPSALQSQVWSSVEDLARRCTDAAQSGSGKSAVVSFPS